MSFSPPQPIQPPMPQKVTPTFTLEEELWSKGYRLIAGVDEAGRGALAGPVVAAAVVAPFRCALAGVWGAVRDSKQLAPQQRMTLAEKIRRDAVAWGIGVVSAQKIDQVGIGSATRQAMMKAVLSLSPAPDHLLIDWVRLPSLDIPQQSCAKADAIIASVAAASILAKVLRDQLLVELADAYPDYDFAVNKGYGTEAHLDAIARLGPCPFHRRSFAPMRLNSRPSE